MGRLFIQYNRERDDCTLMVTWRFGFGCTIVLILVQAGNSKVLVQKSNSEYFKTKANTEPEKMYVEIYNNHIYVGCSY